MHKDAAQSRAIARSLDADIELRYEREQSPVIRRLLDTAQAIEGLARHAGTHAAAVVIAPEPLLPSVKTSPPCAPSYMTLRQKCGHTLAQ